MSWYAEALKIPFTGSKGPILAPEKQHLHTMNSAIRHVTFSWHPPNPDSPIRPPNREAWTCFHCSRVQWLCALHHSIQPLALYFALWGLHVAAEPWKPIPWCSRHTVFVLILMPVEVWNQQRIGYFYAPSTLALGDPTLSLYVLFHFVFELA